MGDSPMGYYDSASTGYREENNEDDNEDNEDNEDIIKYLVKELKE